MRKSYLAVAASLGALLLASAPASAAITFSLSNVTFFGGGTMSGTFTTNDNLSVLEGFVLTTSANTYWWGSFAGREYDSTSAEAVGAVWNPNLGLTALFSDPFTQIGLFFDGPLSATGTTNVKAADEALLGWFDPTRIAVTGSVAAVPEPATWAMMIGGLALVGFSMRRRKVAVSFA